MIKFTVLYSILNGDLIPWLNLNEEFKSEIDSCYLKATALHPINDMELHEQLTELLLPFTALSVYLKEQRPTYPSQIIPSFFSISLPQHTDTFTAFYYLTFRQETLRLFNQIINYCSEMDNEMKSFLVNDYLKYIKYLALSITEKLNELGYQQVPKPQLEPVQYALYVARYFVIHLFFGLQELFADIIKIPIIPKAFFQTFLKELYNENYLVPARHYYENKLMFFIDNNFFSFTNISGLFNQLKADKKLEQKEILTAKYENAIYLHSLENDPSEIKNLLDNALVTELFQNQKTAIQNEIYGQQLGLDRLEIVHNELNKIHYTDSSIKSIHSIPSLLYYWLKTQERVYMNAASSSFVPLINRKITIPPKAIVKKIKIEEQKSIALQYLSFMKGMNAQGKQIMKEAQFNSMISAVNALVETDIVPEIKTPLPQINLPTGYIRYTFYILHKTLYTTKSIKDSWIYFMHNMFSQFKNIETSTTKSKFSDKPSMYDTDMHLVK